MGLNRRRNSLKVERYIPSATTEDICSICLDEFVVSSAKFRKVKFYAKDVVFICSIKSASKDGSTRMITVRTVEDLYDIIIFNVRLVASSPRVLSFYEALLQSPGNASHLQFYDMPV